MPSKKRFAVYTCITDNYDRLLPPVKTDEKILYVVFTDDKSLKVEGWETRLIEADTFSSPSMQNRKIKILPWKYLPDIRRSMYIDGNIKIKSDISRLLDVIDDGFDIVLFRHPERNYVEDEIDACIQLSKTSDPSILQEEFAELKKNGFSDNGRLTENNILIRTHESEALQRSMELWWHYVSNFSGRDQISLGHCLDTESVNKLVLPLCAREENPWFESYPHYSQIDSDFERLLVRLKMRKELSLKNELIYRLAKKTYHIQKKIAKVSYRSIFQKLK